MTPAIKLLDKLLVRYQIREYQSGDSKNYGQQAAEALNQNTAQVFKTLVAIVDGNQRKLVVALVAVADQLDLKKLAACTDGRKAAMADTSLAEKVTGYVTGGISPFGQRQLLPTIVDKTALNFTSIYVSGGKRGLQLELDPQDVIRVLNAHCAEISRPA